MAKSKEQSKKSDDDDFWGSSAEMPDMPPASSHRPAQYLPAAPPAAIRPLLEHLQPMFLYVCEQHRLKKDGILTEASYETIRQKVLDKMTAVNQAGNHDPVLRQHLDKLGEPILWFIDNIFSSPENDFPFLRKWNKDRLARADKDGNFTGDDAFFDELGRELQTDPRDESSNERLAFYYTAIGLGFTGRFYNRDAQDRKELKSRMLNLYPRVARYVDADASGKITPESYRSTDKRDFVAPSRDKPMIFFAAFLLLLGSLLFGYIYWYMQKTAPLREGIERLQQKDTVAE